MGVKCECGTTLKNVVGLRKHQRNVCKLTERIGNDALTEECCVCGRKFISLQSLNLHKSSSHPVEYNLQLEHEVKSKPRNKLWTDAEVDMLARLEVAHITSEDKSTSLNDFLAVKLKRTVNSIKGRRKRPDYRNLVKEYLDNPSFNSRAAPTSPETDSGSDDSFKSTNSSINEIDSETPINARLQENVINESSRSPKGSYSARYMASNCAVLTTDPVVDDTSSARYMATRGVSTYSDVVEQHLQHIAALDEYINYREAINNLLINTNVGGTINNLVAQLLPGATRRQGIQRKTRGSKRHLPAPMTETPHKKPKSNYSKRAHLYKRWQEMYISDKKNLAAKLVSGESPDAISSFPDIISVEAEYTKIFSDPSPSDNHPVNLVDYGPDLTYRPFLYEDILSSLHDVKPSSPGPDKVTSNDLKKSDPRLLEVLFNGIIFTGHLPSSFNECRTTLVPKKGDPLNVNNWRPITITSVLARLFNRMLAKRLSSIALHCAQRGFRPVDGCLANTILLQTAIKQLRAKAQPYNITTIDLRKAFDTVSHHSIPRALKRVGVHTKTIRLITSMYSGCTTTIRCGRKTTSPIQMNRGVKQGDPLSPAIFNLVMDELLCDLDHNIGISIGDAQTAAIAYADDVLLIGPSDEAVSYNLERLNKFLVDRGLQVNVAKCTTMSVRRVPKKKKLFCASDSIIAMNGTRLPVIGPGDFFKYLGRNYDFSGVEKTDSTTLKSTIANLVTAGLKPNQKLDLLRNYIIPRAIHDLQYPGITAKTLKTCDLSIKGAVKRILHLPAQTSNAFLHARTRDGGLGICKLADIIPVILHNRLQKLASSNDVWSAAALNSTQGRSVLRRLQKQMKNGSTGEALKNKMRRDLEISYSGNGTSQGNGTSANGNWVYQPPPFWTGRDYVRAVQLKGNLLPTRGIPANPPEQRGCRAGCARQESLCHVLQRCPATHWSRVKRHDRIVQLLARAASKPNSKYKVETEPRIRCSDGVLRKPDLVFLNEKSIIVCDVGIHWEGPCPLTDAFNQKINYYSNEAFTEGLRNKYGNKDIHITAYILGARGTWCSLNNTLKELIGLTRYQVNETIWDTMKGSWTIHSDFYRRTSRTSAAIP